MALPLSGAISMSQVNTELSYSSTAQIGLNDAAVRTLFGVSSGAISVSNGYGKSAGPPTIIGQAYGGGYYAGKINVSGTQYYLIVAPKSSGESQYRQWKTSWTSTPGTSSVIDGPTNSANMNNASHPPAQFCKSLSIGGYTDWYMPAKNELEVLYYFLKPTTDSNSTSYGSNANAVSPEPISTNYSSGSPAQTSASAFRTGNSEAFTTTLQYYWSSTEYSSDSAWAQLFGSGGQHYAYKNGYNAVRAVRRVAV